MINVLDYYRQQHPWIGELGLADLQAEHAQTYGMLAGTYFDENNSAAKAFGDRFSAAMGDAGFADRLDAALAKNAQSDGSNPLALKLQALTKDTTKGIPALDSALTSIGSGADVEQSINQAYGSVFRPPSPAAPANNSPASSAQAGSKQPPKTTATTQTGTGQQGSGQQNQNGGTSPADNGSTPQSDPSKTGGTPPAGTAGGSTATQQQHASGAADGAALVAALERLFKAFGDAFKDNPMVKGLGNFFGKFFKNTKDDFKKLFGEITNPDRNAPVSPMVGLFKTVYGMLRQENASRMAPLTGDPPTDPEKLNAFRTAAFVHAVDDKEIAKVDTMKTADGKQAVEHEKQGDAYIMTLHTPDGGTEYWGRFGRWTDATTGVTSMGFERLNPDKKTVYVDPKDHNPQFFIAKAGNLGTNQDIASFDKMAKEQNIDAMINATADQSDKALTAMQNLMQTQGLSGKTAHIVGVGGFSGGNATMAELQVKLKAAGLAPDQISEINPVGAGLGIRTVIANTPDDKKAEVVDFLRTNVATFRPYQLSSDEFFESPAGLKYDNAGVGKVYEFTGVSNADPSNLWGSIFANHDSSVVANDLSQKKPVARIKEKEFTTDQLLNQNTRATAGDQVSLPWKIQGFDKYEKSQHPVDAVAHVDIVNPIAPPVAASTASVTPAPVTTAADMSGVTARRGNYRSALNQPSTDDAAQPEGQQFVAMAYPAVPENLPPPPATAQQAQTQQGQNRNRKVLTPVGATAAG